VIGQTISHYRIVEQIGAGGMGVVYRAQDEQLQRDVAIKVLPDGMLADETARKRFRKEALSLAKLNHPNIATVHEFGTQDGADFLVTEYIAGIMLDTKLLKGAMPVREIIGLGTQLAHGLVAAHQQGIVHRDLKPANLRLTPDERLKILDFGLAHLMPHASDFGLTATMTTSQEVTGTLPYMAPEQLRGEPIDARSDIWGVGAILYEMATGKRPFPETTGPLLINAILNHEPESPSRINARVSPGLEKVILKALDKDPAQRYRTANELSADLDRLTAGLAPQAPERTELNWQLIVTGCAFLVVGLAVGGYFARRVWSGRLKSTATVVTSAIKARHSVAVLGFKNLTGDPNQAWLSTALSEMLTTELAAGGKLLTIPGESVAQMKASLSLPEADSYGQETLARIRKNLGTDAVVLGSYLALSGGRVRLDLKLEDATSGEIVDSVTENGTETEISDLISSAGAALRDKLGAGAVSSDEAAQVKASLPTNPGAARYYAEGLAKMRAFDNLGARDSLQKAVAAEPNLALAHAALAEALSGLGYDVKSADEAKRAFDLSSNLPGEQRLAIEGRYYEANKNWAKAVDVYHTLWTFSPDNLDHGLRLAAAQTSGAQAKEAIATVEALHKMPPPASEDPRIDVAESLAAHGLSDFRRELAIAKRAEQKGEAQGARLLVARAKLGEARALFSLGDAKESQHAAEDAKRLFAEAGDRNGEATALHNIASAISEEGDNAAAMKLHQQALEVCRTIGNRRCMSDALNSIGVIYKDEANFTAAQPVYEQSLALRREIGDRGGEAVGLNNLGVLLYQQGKLAAARKMYEQALGISREIGEKRGIVRALTNLGIVLTAQGELAKAGKVEEESLAIRRGIGDKVGTAIALNNLAELLLDQGDLATAQKYVEEQADLDQKTGNQRGLAYARFVQGELLLAQGKHEEARKAHEEALAIRTRMGEKTTAEDSRLALGILSIEQGHVADAEGPAREIRDQAHAGKEPQVEITAEIVLARCLLVLGRTPEARVEISKAEKLARSSEDRLQQIEVGIVSARVHSAIRASVDQVKRLEAMIAQAKRYGCVACEFEARLALGEVEIRSARAASGRARLAHLEKDSAAKGFLLIASKARVAN
jgi:tetratricopeptide (TPR) repeat protein/TolB-like protein